MGGQIIDEPEFIDAEFEEDFEKQLTVRQDFRETWIFEDVIVGYVCLHHFIEKFITSMVL